MTIEDVIKQFEDARGIPHSQDRARAYDEAGQHMLAILQDIKQRETLSDALDIQISRADKLRNQERLINAGVKLFRKFIDQVNAAGGLELEQLSPQDERYEPSGVKHVTRLAGVPDSEAMADVAMCISQALRILGEDGYSLKYRWCDPEEGEARAYEKQPESPNGEIKIDVQSE